MLANYPRFFYVYISNGLKLFVSLSAQPLVQARHSVAFIGFFLLRSASNSSSGVKHFSLVSPKVRALMRHDHVKLFVGCASHTGNKVYCVCCCSPWKHTVSSYLNVVLLYYVQFIRIRTIITVASAGHVNSQYHHIGILSHFN